MVVFAILAVLILVGGGVTAAVVLIKNQDSAEKAPEQTQPPEAADDSVITQKTGPEVVKYGDLAVLDACTLMPVAMIEGLGFEVAAHGWRSQTYVPRSVPASVSGQFTDVLSSCRYESPDKELTRFTLSVRQPPFSRMGRVDRQGEDETPLTVPGVKAFLRPGLKPDAFNARVIGGDNDVEAILGAGTMADNKKVTDYQATFIKLVEQVAANIVKGPQGRTTNVHTGRYASVPNVCDVLSAELFEEIVQEEDSGLVEADFREQEEFRKFVTDKNETLYFYSNKQGCRRMSSSWFMAANKRDGKALKIELTTFRTADMAVRSADDCNPDSPSRSITGEAVLTDEKIGDFAACSFMVGPAATMSFVAGRTQVQLTADGAWAPKDPRKYNATFAPIAKRVVDEVRKAIG